MPLNAYVLRRFAFLYTLPNVLQRDKSSAVGKKPPTADGFILPWEVFPLSVFTDLPRYSGRFLCAAFYGTSGVIFNSFMIYSR